MLGPKPYKIPSYDFTGFKNIGAYVNGEFIGEEELFGIGESPRLVIPSTYAAAVNSDETLSVVALKEPSPGSEATISFNEIKRIAVGLPIPEETDPNAFGGGIGLQKVNFSAVYQPPAAPALTGEVLVSPYELGSRLVNVGGVTSAPQPTVLGTTGNTDIIEIQQLTAPAAPEILDGGGF